MVLLNVLWDANWQLQLTMIILLILIMGLSHFFCFFLRPGCGSGSPPWIISVRSKLWIGQISLLCNKSSCLLKK